MIVLRRCECADVFYSFNWERSWREASRKEQWNCRWLSKRMISVDDEKICFDVLLGCWQSCSFARLAFVLFLYSVIIVRLSEINRKIASTCPHCQCCERERKHRKRKQNCDDWFLFWEGMHPCAVLSVSLFRKCRKTKCGISSRTKISGKRHCVNLFTRSVPPCLDHLLTFIAILDDRRTLRKSTWTDSDGNFRRKVRLPSVKPVLRRFSFNLVTSSDVKTRSPTRLDVLLVKTPADFPWIMLDEEERRRRGWLLSSPRWWLELLTCRCADDRRFCSIFAVDTGGEIGRNDMLDTDGMLCFDLEKRTVFSTDTSNVNLTFEQQIVDSVLRSEC